MEKRLVRERGVLESIGILAILGIGNATLSIEFETHAPSAGIDTHREKPESMHQGRGRKRDAQQLDVASGLCLLVNFRSRG